MKTLHLNLKNKWFDMILLQLTCPELAKREEYREIKTYWINRFLDYSEYPAENKKELRLIPENILFDIKYNNFDFPNDLHLYFLKLKDYKTITFTNGYSKNARSFVIEFNGIEIGVAKPEWSDNWEGNVFRLKLGNIISTKNIK